MPGVYRTKKKNGQVYYRTSITYRGKHISLGSFSTEKKAGRCYEEARELINSKTLEISDYNGKYAIPFDKWVSILNFKVNNLYSSNPIFIRKRFFFYYLTPKKVLTFDMDDLFYFSSHKIMERGKHLFVDDFGVQTSLQSRFHIQPYAVEGKDYVFRNGDNLDYRYENLEIINPYFGVRKEMKGVQTAYRVTLHERSTLLVGVYEDLTTAAIAYNKAVDILKKNGCTKEFQENFLEGISPSVYADIYSKVKIRKSIYQRKFSN
ncbi:MAG: hypothetical protein K5682_04600 [Lachnospiraceae bacterium]|nr:hypothetical protein [Lachnospiraceae bacterium]